MATTATLTINAEDIIGADFDRSRASIWVEANTEHGLIVVDGTNVRVGGRRELLVDGVATFELVTTNSADNPTSFGYRVTITYVPKGSRKQGHDTITTSDFPFTASANLAAIPEAWDNVTAPVEWRSAFRDEMEALRDETVTISGLEDVEGAVDLVLAGSPNFGGGFKSQPDYGVANTIIVKPSTDTAPGIIEWAHDSPSGYLLHLVSRPNMGDQAALIGMGIDYDGVGLLLANKLNGTGLHVHNHATATSQAVGISGLQMSTAAPLLSFSQGAAGAKELIKLFADATRTAGQQMQVWQNSAMTLGYVEAAGLFRWQHSAYFKQGATGTSALRVEGVTGSTVNVLDVLLPAGGGTPFAVAQTGVVTTMHGTKIRNDNALTENPLRVTNMSTTANVDTLRIVGVSGQLGDQLSIRDSASVVQSRFNKAGYFITAKSSAPADADLNNFELALWVDATPGSTKLMLKAKDSGGTVRTGSVALA